MTSFKMYFSEHPGLLHSLIVAPVLGYVFLFIYGVYTRYSPVPFWDLWDAFVMFNTLITEVGAGLIFHQHVDHFLVVQNIISLVDWRFFGGTLVFSTAILAISCAAMCIVYIRWSQPLNLTHVAVLIFLSLSWVQRENLGWAFQSQMFMVLFFAALSFSFMERYFSHRAWHELTLAIFFGCLASVTMSNGIFVLPVLTIYVYRGTTDRKLLAFVAAVTFLVLLVFSSFYTPSRATGFGPLIEAGLLKLIWVYLKLIGAPLYMAFPAIGGVGAGLVGIGVLVMMLAGFWHLHVKSKVNRAYIPFAFFLLMSSALVVAARFSFDPDLWKTSRYMTMVLSIWCVCYLIAARVDSYIFIWGRRVFVGLTLLVATAQVQVVLQDARMANFQKLLAAVAIYNEVPDVAQISHVWPGVEVISHARKAAVARKGVFSLPLVNGDQVGLSLVDRGSVEIYGIHRRPIENSNYDHISFVLKGFGSNSEFDHFRICADELNVGFGLSMPFTVSPRDRMFSGYILKGQGPLCLQMSGSRYSII